MKIKYIKTLKDGSRHVLVELTKSDPMPIRPPHEDYHYRVGYPMNDVISGHILKEMKLVFWDSRSQKWVDAI
jgi:hypothetical protein